MHHHLQRTWADIDLDAVTHNYREIERHIDPACRILAVIKANGYGHGIEGVARALSDAGAGWFAVSNLEEAVQLRRQGMAQRILILSHTPPEEAGRLAEFDVTTAVVDLPHARALSAEAGRLGVSLTVHIKIDTGMGRVGCVDAEQTAAICELPNLHFEGIFTHFATADMPDDSGFIELQFNRFMEIVETLKNRGITFLIRHCCNSAAAIRRPEMHLDMIRPGIILYGCPPDRWMAGIWDLRPVMAVKTAVIQVKKLGENESVGYGRTFSADKPILVATVPIGYADGYPRAAGNRAFMLVNGRPAPVIGRVCMDQCMLDVTGIPNVKQGTVAVVFGADSLPAEQLAEWDGTISYETLCKIGKRVPRVFRRGGEIVDVVTMLNS
ncbi:MAG: alanine racemase [Oscillospiraceae bacterium]|nr:alanine racemase [Oscillospiraceae bacterium]